MIAEILAVFVYLFENCTGVVLIESYENSSVINSFDTRNLVEPLDHLRDFTEFDPDDTISQEYDPPYHLEDDPKAWKQSLPAFSKSFWECLKTVLVIQAVAGTLIGIVAIGIVFLDFSTVTWCYDQTPHWYKMPKSVQHLRVLAQSVEGFFIQLWDLPHICTIIPCSLVCKLNLLAFDLASAFLDVVYRLNLQMFGVYQASWKSFPLNALFSLTIFTNHFLIARNFYPNSFKNTIKLFFILTAQFILGLPVTFAIIYKIFPLYVSQGEHMKIIIAAFCPVVFLIPKVVSRLGAQRLHGVIHPGRAHVLVSALYGMTAVVFRVMQSELTSLGLFIALGIAHAIIDLLERITITMRDHIWEYLYRLVRRQRSRPPKYHSPRSRRFIADVSIQIILQEPSALITALGSATIYQAMYSKPRPFINNELLIGFCIRAAIGLSIDLFFNTLSLLIQTRVMNTAVIRVWKKKWRHHLIVNCLVVWFSVIYFSEHLFAIVRNKYDSVQHPNIHQRNCSFPSFL